MINIHCRDNDRYPILDEVGHIGWKLCATAEVCEINWEALGGFEQIQCQIGSEDVFPIAWLANIEVYSEFPGNGFGNRGLQMFERAASLSKARVAMLKVGGDGQPGMDRNSAWYQRRGWIFLPSVRPDEPAPIHYLDLRSFEKGR